MVRKASHEKKLSYCQECHMKCPIDVTVDAGKVIRVSRHACEKGQFLREKIYDPKRLKTALRRVGARGEGRWAAIPIEEALDESASRLANIKAKYGPEALATYTTSFHRENSAAAAYLLANFFNSPHVLSSNHLCVLPDSIAQLATFGSFVTMDWGPDFRHSGLIVLWGVNLWATRPRAFLEVRKAKRKGARVIVIDPRPTQEAKEADLWLRVRPGSDGALALGLAHVLIKENLYDKDFVRDWTVGFDQLAAHVQEWTPARVSEITWVPEAQIIEAARLLGTVKTAAFHTRQGTAAAQANATQTSRAIAILLALVNSLETKGGNFPPHDYDGFRSMFDLSGKLRASPDVEDKRFGAKEYPLLMGVQPPAGAKPGTEAYNLTASSYYHAHNHFGYQAMLDGKLKGVVSFASNFVINDVEARKTVEALKNIDFFLAVDLFSTATTDFADIILPPAHWLESEYVLNNWLIPSDPAVYATRRVVEPPPGLLSDVDIAIAIARRAGETTRWASSAEFNNWRLEPLGITLNELQDRPEQKFAFSRRCLTYKEHGFPTLSGKVELYSSVFEKLGHDPLPVYNEPPESPVSTPDLAAEYPLILTDYRVRYYTHSELRSSPSLRKLAPDPELQIHPDTARAAGVKDGDWIYVETTPAQNPGRYKVKARARYTSELDPRVIAAVSHWWYPEKSDLDSRAYAVNINSIKSQSPPYDPMSGVPQVRATLSRVSKVS